MSVRFPKTDAEIETFLAAFEAATLPKARWTHAAHLLCGAAYVHALGEVEATDRMRLCVRRYNEAVGGQNTATSGYHETVTVLWIKLLTRLRHEHPAASRPEFVALAVATYADSRTVLSTFYDFDVIASTDARQRWVPPNLGSL